MPTENGSQEVEPTLPSGVPCFSEKLGLNSRHFPPRSCDGSEASGKIIFQKLFNIITKVFVVAAQFSSTDTEVSKDLYWMIHPEGITTSSRAGFTTDLSVLPLNSIRNHHPHQQHGLINSTYTGRATEKCPVQLMSHSHRSKSRTNWRQENLLIFFLFANNCLQKWDMRLMKMYVGIAC